MLKLLKLLQCCDTDVFFALLYKMVTIDVETIMTIVVVITVIAVIALKAALVIMAAT